MLCPGSAGDFALSLLPMQGCKVLPGYLQCAYFYMNRDRWKKILYSGPASMPACYTITYFNQNQHNTGLDEGHWPSLHIQHWPVTLSPRHFAQQASG